MKYTTLGRTGMKVSKLCLGTMIMGGRISEADSFAMMDRALDAGINFFDTADHYGVSSTNPKSYNGYTEEILGKWFAQGGGRRESVFLATKAYMMTGDRTLGVNDKNGISAYKLRRNVEASLKRMRTDHIDLHYMHHVPLEAGWQEMWDAYQALYYQGKVTYVGGSNFAGRQITYAQCQADRRNFLGLSAEQDVYNLTQRITELEVQPACRDLGIGFMCYSPLAAGMLSEHALNAPTGSRSLRIRWTERQRKQIEAFHEFCLDISEKESTVALAWLLSRPDVTAVVLGCRTMEQLENSIHALDVELTQKELAELDRIFPPVGEAPFAYEW